MDALRNNVMQLQAQLANREEKASKIRIISTSRDTVDNGQEWTNRVSMRAVPSNPGVSVIQHIDGPSLSTREVEPIDHEPSFRPLDHISLPFNAYNSFTFDALSHAGSDTFPDAFFLAQTQQNPLAGTQHGLLSVIPTPSSLLPTSFSALHSSPLRDVVTYPGTGLGQGMVMTVGLDRRLSVSSPLVGRQSIQTYCASAPLWSCAWAEVAWDSPWILLSGGADGSIHQLDQRFLSRPTKTLRAGSSDQYPIHSLLPMKLGGRRYLMYASATGPYAAEMDPVLPSSSPSFTREGGSLPLDEGDPPHWRPMNGIINSSEDNLGQCLGMSVDPTWDHCVITYQNREKNRVSHIAGSVRAEDNQEVWLDRAFTIPGNLLSSPLTRSCFLPQSLTSSSKAQICTNGPKKGCLSIWGIGREGYASRMHQELPFIPSRCPYGIRAWRHARHRTFLGVSCGQAFSLLVDNQEAEVDR